MQRCNICNEYSPRAQDGVLLVVERGVTSNLELAAAKSSYGRRRNASKCTSEGLKISGHYCCGITSIVALVLVAAGGGIVVGSSVRILSSCSLFNRKI